MPTLTVMALLLLRSRRRVPVGVDRAEVIGRDEARRFGAGKLAVAESDERVPPDRPADGEPPIPGHAGPGAQPLVDASGARSATEHYARDPLASPAAGLPRHAQTLRALVEPFDLPHVRLHAVGLHGGDRAHDEVGPDLAVVPLAVLVHPIELLGRGRHEELEEELPPVRV